MNADPSGSGSPTPILYAHRENSLPGFVSPVVRIGSALSLIRIRVLPPPPSLVPGGHTHLRERGWADPQFGHGDRHCDTLGIIPLRSVYAIIIHEAHIQDGEETSQVIFTVDIFPEGCWGVGAGCSYGSPSSYPPFSQQIRG